MDVNVVIAMLTVFILIITAADVYSNRLVSENNKKEILRICFLIFISAIAKFISNELVGTEGYIIACRKFVKLVELCTVPCIGFAAAYAYGLLKAKNAAKIFLLLHMAFETVALFNNWVFSIGADGVYHREKLYFLYVAVLTVSIICCVFCIAVGNRRYQADFGIVNLIILLFVISGEILAPMLIGRTSVNFMCIAIANLFLYHYRGIIVNQIDVTTRLLNRRCFEMHKKNVQSPSFVLMLDINNFKNVNDTFGHAAGDACLRQVATRIYSVFGSRGFCYRIGGDEFCVILTKKLDSIRDLSEQLQQSVKELKKYYGDEFGLASGYSYYVSDVMSIEGAIAKADDFMYKDKKRAYAEAENK